MAEPLAPRLPRGLAGVRDREFLETAYQTVLRRRIDPKALANYLEALSAGYPRERVLGDLFDGEEFRDRSVSWLCGPEARAFSAACRRFAGRHGGPPRGERLVLVALTHPDPAFKVRNALIASHLARRRGLGLLGLGAEGRLRELDRLLGSAFGMVAVEHLDLDPEPEELPGLPPGFGAGPVRQELLGLEFDGLPVGDLVYDTFLREERAGTILARDERVDLHVRRALHVHAACEALWRRHAGRIAATVQDHAVYTAGGILARGALARGIPVYLAHGRSSPLALRRLERPADAFEYELRFGPEWLRAVADRTGRAGSEAGRRLVEGFCGGGEGHQHTLLDGPGRRIYRREELCALLGLDPGAPLVLVVAHLMADAPHQQGPMLFEDYYQWLAATLAIAAGVRGVNWVLKEHPFDQRFTDRHGARDALAALPCGGHSIRLAPADAHPGTLGAADAVVTARGTAGLEAAVLGLPCLVAGRAPYTGHGLVVEPATREEYAAALRNIARLPAPSMQARERAAALAHLYFDLSRVECAFLPRSRYVALGSLPDAEQWSYMAARLDDTPLDQDPLWRNLEAMEESGAVHLLDFERIGALAGAAP